MSEIDEKDLREVTGGAEGGLGNFDGTAWRRQNCDNCSKRPCTDQIGILKFAERRWNQGIDWACTARIARKG